MHFCHSGSACEYEYHVYIARPGSAADPSPLRQPASRGPVGHGRDGRAGARDAEGPAAAAGDRLAPSGALVKALLLGGAAGLEGFEGDTGLPLAPPPSFRQGFGRVDLRRSLPLQVRMNPNPTPPASRASRLDPRICGRGARQGYASWAARRADGARRSLKAQAGAHRVAARNVLTRTSALRRSGPLRRRGPGRRRARAQGSGPRWALQLVDGAALRTGEAHQYCLTATGGPLTVTLVWHDYPAAPSAARALVNDLDLAVRAAGLNGFPLLARARVSGQAGRL